jgi:hypothetical protein
MGLIPTVVLASQLAQWNKKVEGPQPSRTICTLFIVLDEHEQIEQLLEELRPDEGVQHPTARDLRHNYRRYDVPS